MDKSFKYELLKLAWAKYSIGVAYMDRFLADFSAAWRHLPHDANGVSGSVPSPKWVQEYLAIEKQHKDAQGNFHLPNSGVTGNINAETGDITLQGQMGNMIISHLDLVELVRNAMAGPPPEMPVQGTLNTGQNAYEFSSQLKERQERNLAELERWAKASSRSWPNSK